MHLVEILEHVGPAYHVRDESEIESPEMIHHFDQWKHERLSTPNWLDVVANSSINQPLRIALTSGASCPDVLVDEVLLKLLDWFPERRSLEEVMQPYTTVASESKG